MAPKAPGASSRVNSMLRANRTACSATLPAPSQVPPRISLGPEVVAERQVAITYLDAVVVSS